MEQDGKMYSTSLTFTARIIYMYQGMPNHEGKAVVTQMYRDFFSKFTAQVSVHVEEVRVFGDMAFDRATYTARATPKAGGETVIIKGRVLEILRKETGKWKSLRVMVNSED